MYVAQYTEGQGWSGQVQPYGPLAMLPSAQVINYGQSIFEGLKAQRSSKGNVVLVRPEANAERFQAGAARMCMPPVPSATFLEALDLTVRANQGWVPPQGKGSLYLRPLLIGSGPILGLGPAPSYTFLVFCAAVGQYFQGALNLLVETHFHRAAPGGMGGTKAAGNYSPVLKVQLAAKKQGYHDVLFLDACSETYLEEVSSCNIFVVKGDTVRTPPLTGTILPGVTRSSILQLAKDLGYQAEEAPISIHEALEADEVFTTGTAVGVSVVNSITYQGRRREYCRNGIPTPAAAKLQ